MIDKHFSQLFSCYAKISFLKTFADEPFSTKIETCYTHTHTHTHTHTTHTHTHTHTQTHTGVGGGGGLPVIFRG